MTASIAGSYNRDVFALPGRAGDILSEGCNNLIKHNKAALITSVDDLLEAMSWAAPAQPVQMSLFAADETLPAEELPGGGDPARGARRKLLATLQPLRASDPELRFVPASGLE